MKIQEIYTKSTTTQVEEQDREDSMHWNWKTKYDNDLSSKNIQNQPRTILETIRYISSSYVGKDGQEFVVGFLLILGLWTCFKWIVSDTSFLDIILKEEYIHTSGMAIGAICVLGPWISTLLLCNIIFSLMWPLLLITGIILAIPTWREYITDEYLPDRFYIADGVTAKLPNSTMTFTASC